VERIDTHISTLFFAGGYVYKVKKAVQTPFLDFSTVRLRRHFCEEEVRLNRRLAPEVYLGVVAIQQRPSGELCVAPTDSSDGSVVDYAVQMEELPREQMLDARLQRAEIDNSDINALVQLLADFHAAAACDGDVAQYGAPDAIRDIVLGNVEELEPSIQTGLLTAEMQEFLRRRATAFLDQNEALLAARVRDGRIRDGHGDLHAANICVRESDIVVYDCIEFTPRFRCGDVAADLAFLAMDLDYRQFRGFSRYFVRRYAQVVHDDALSKLVDFYKAHRALVRAKVVAMQQAASTDVDDSRRLMRSAQQYVHLAASYAFPRTLILMCGLPGSGKSWAARALVRPFEAVHLASDVVRKEFEQRAERTAVADCQSRSQAEGATLDAGRYDVEQVERVYQRLAQRAGAALDDHRSVVVDATFGIARRRSQFVALANERGVPVVIVHRTCDLDETTRRLAARATDPDEASEADLHVHELLASRFEAPMDSAQAPVVEVGDVATPEDVARALFNRLIEAVS
ncbi:MAG: AAA family ATPase, partial [Planctomycetota bacterium]